MSWKIEVKPNAEKQYLKLDNTTRRRIKKALLELEQKEGFNQKFYEQSLRENDNKVVLLLDKFIL